MMKLEEGSQKVVEGIPQQLTVAAGFLGHFCHEINFLRTKSGIYYAVGEVQGDYFADIYLRYEQKVRKADLGDGNPDGERVIVTIKCYAVLWLPILGKPQLCVFEQEIKEWPPIHIAQAKGAIAGANELFKSLNSANGYNLNMARNLIRVSESLMPKKVFTKLTRAFEGDELPGMPPTRKTDVLGRFVAATQGYYLARISRYHISFFYSLFRSEAANAVKAPEATLFDAPKLTPTPEPEPEPEPEEIDETHPVEEEIPVEETGEGAALDNETPPAPRSSALNPDADSELVGKLVFAYPDALPASIESFVKSARKEGEGITDDEIREKFYAWIPHHLKWRESQGGGKKRAAAPKQEAPKGEPAIPTGSGVVPASKPVVRRLGMPKRK